MELDRLILPSDYTCVIKEDNRAAASSLSSVIDLESALATMGFDVKTSSNGDLNIGRYHGRLSEELNEYLNALAPFIEPGGYIEWGLIKDESSHRKQWYFDVASMMDVGYLDEEPDTDLKQC